MKRHVPNSLGRGKRTGNEMKTRPDRPRHCCGRKIRTSDLWVMSPTSYRCSIPHLDSTPRGRSRRAANEVIARLVPHVVRGLLVRDLHRQCVVLRLVRDEVAAVSRDLACDRVALDSETDERRGEHEPGQGERHRDEAPTKPNTPRPATMSRAHPRIMQYE